jgi:Domain of unknown function (DUF4412)
MQKERGGDSMKTHLTLAVVVLAAGMLASSVEAGLLMAYRQEVPGRPAKATTVYVERDRMRTETRGERLDQVIIFRGDRKLYWVIDNREGTYTEITREDLKKLQGRMDEAKKTYEEQMKKMTPEQRKMVEAMMKDRMPVQPPRTVYRKTASGVKVNRWVCDRYDGVQEGEKKEEVWTADPKQLEVRPEEFRVFDDIRDFSEEFSKQGLRFYRMETAGGKKESGYAGVPVRIIRYSRGKPLERMELTEVRRKDAAPSLFELPGGLKKKELGR